MYSIILHGKNITRILLPNEELYQKVSQNIEKITPFSLIEYNEEFYCCTLNIKNRVICLAKINTEETITL